MRLVRLLLIFFVVLGLGACSLVVDFDRSRLPDGGVEGGIEAPVDAGANGLEDGREDGPDEGS